MRRWTRFISLRADSSDRVLCTRQ